MRVLFYKKAMPLHRHRHWLITACLLILSLLSAGAKDEFTSEEKKKFQEQKLAAEKGESSAQLQLGHCYYNGWGVTKNVAEAEKWYAMSSEQGNVTAQFYLKTLRERAKTEEIDAAAKGPSSTQGQEPVRERLRNVRIPNEYQPRAENHDINSALRTKPARVLVAWIIFIPVILTIIIFVFFWNIYARWRLEKSLQDDVRFNSRFQPHSRQHPAPGISILWLVTGLVIVITGLFVFISFQGIGAVFGVLLMIGGASMVVYNSYQGAGEQNQGPEDRLLEVQFQKDRVRLLYSITGQRELVFGPDLRVWIGTREKYQGGITIFGELYARVFTGIDIYATFKDAIGKVELELDFPGTAEFIALCRHHGAEINLSLNLDAHVATRLAATPSWQPNWKPDDLDQTSERDHSSAKPKLWNPLAIAIWSFLLCAGFGSWLQAANWRELGRPEKARRCMAWFYGFIFSAITYAFILPYFIRTPALLDYTWGFLITIIWYFFIGKEQIEHVRESQLSYERKSWLKPILTFCVIFAAWFGICVGSDEFFQATLRTDAFRGDASAQRALAWMYANGKDVTEDQEEASRLYRKAAEQGDQYAQAMLGIRLQEGKGTPKNEVEALKWFRLSANQGNYVAQNMMGECYFHGVGIEKNHEEAAKWYKKSAENGYAESQNELGYCYFNGNGVQKDLVESLKWHRMAADQGNAEAQYIVGMRHATGAGTEKSASMAVIWYRRAAKQGYAPAQFLLGNCYANGLGVESDPIETVKWYTKAADQGNMRAQHYLGNCYYNGQGTTPNLPEALKYWRLAADAGYGESQYNIGVCHLEGIGVPKDEVMALIWLRKAAGQGDTGALFALGRFHLGSVGSNLSIKKDMTEAYAYFTLAGVTLEKARKELADLEKKMDAQSISNGKKRALDLKKEIESKSSGPQPSK
jgi:TPR repeat protein